MKVVIDSCVWLDMFLTHRSGHANAALLAERLRREEGEIEILIPMHAEFEITSAIMCEKRSAAAEGRALHPNESISEDRPLKCTLVPIDLQFFHRHATGEMPDLKSGDMIFVLLALHDGLDLVTEDKKMLSEARRLGVSAFTTAEYLTHLNGRTPRVRVSS
jgi:predicted nucleic acid-binding protein